MVNKTQTNLYRSDRPAFGIHRASALAIGLLTCSLTGCVANWSVLGDRMPGASHAAEPGCPTCAAPQTVVVPPVPVAAAQTPPSTTPSVTTTNNAVAPGGTQLNQPPQQVPPVPESDAAACRKELQQLSDTMQEMSRQNAEVVTGLMNRIERMKLDSQQRDQDAAREFREMRLAIEQLTPGQLSPPPSSPAPLLPAPEGSQPVNELKALPPVNGSL